MPPLPVDFIERFSSIIPSEFFEQALKTFTDPRKLSVRINSLKTTVEAVKEFLNEFEIKYSAVSWYPHGLVLEKLNFKQQARFKYFIEGGFIYQQSLTSMLIACLLNPQPQESVLDLCAAPGSKATQMAAMMNNEGCLVCVEAIKGRFYKLKSVVNLMGVKNIEVKLMDGRRFRSDKLFDKILIDAPCSSEARFHLDTPKTFAYWSLRKIKEMSRKQKGLLLNAGRMLKPGGRLVYSTCSFAPEENEAVIDWFLKKTERQFKVESLLPLNVQSYPAFSRWQGRIFNPEVTRSLRVLPDSLMEGFFIASLIKLPDGEE